MRMKEMRGFVLLKDQLLDESNEEIDGVSTTRLLRRTPVRLPGEEPPFCPPKHLIFDLFFFRQLFDHLEKKKCCSKERKLHVFVVYNTSVRLLDAIGLDGEAQYGNGFWGRRLPGLRKSWYSWQDLCLEVKRHGTPEVPLNLAERIYMTLDDPASSLVARVLSIFMAAIILGNLLVIILTSMGDVCFQLVPFSYPGHCGGHFQRLCILLFTAEYVIKLCCIGFVRVEMFDMGLVMQACVPVALPKTFAETPPLTRGGRLFHWVTSAVNLVDLVSILPFWLQVVLGNLLPPSSTSFLRVIRITRIFRILKTGRYLQMLQVLFKTLAKSGQSMVVLLLFVFIVALVAGCMLQQLEEGEGFDSVPLASFWVMARLISMKDCSFLEGKVLGAPGICVLATVMAFKAILWILPIGQIKAAFDCEYEGVVTTQAMKDELAYEMNRPSWSLWYGLQKSCRSHVELWPGDTTDGPPAGSTHMPVPIFSSKAVMEELEVDIPEGSLRQGCERMPSISVSMSWEPSEEMDEHKGEAPVMPSGTLRLGLRRGNSFPTEGPASWTCRIRVATGCCGSIIEGAKVVSSCGGSSPSFDCCVEFEVNWAIPAAHKYKPTSRRESLQAAAVVVDPAKEEAEFRRRVLSLLEEQGKRITALENLGPKK
mmetsp:Transcript_45975/g.103330  ORF Transcript_45975/g.103330 Transcript_45975/m.103330 type:complete len:651 (-) Transcript_45975:1-1953(-)